MSFCIHIPVEAVNPGDIITPPHHARMFVRDLTTRNGRVGIRGTVSVTDALPEIGAPAYITLPPESHVRLH